MGSPSIQPPRIMQPVKIALMSFGSSVLDSLTISSLVFMPNDSCSMHVTGLGNHWLKLLIKVSVS
jgi:hypothetical protein